MVAYEVINNGIPTVEYQNRDIAANVMHLTHDDNGIVAYPNPTFGPVVIDLFNYPYDQYNFEVYNIVGKRIFSKSFSPRDRQAIKGRSKPAQKRYLHVFCYWWYGSKDSDQEGEFDKYLDNISWYRGLCPCEVWGAGREERRRAWARSALRGVWGGEP